MNVGERHDQAVAQSCRFAQEAAEGGDFEEALAWLLAVEAADGPLSAEWAGKRTTWARQSGAPNGNGAPTSPHEARATRASGRP